MAVAEIIGAAVGILLLVIVAYLIVGGTLSVAETVSSAQKDLTATTESRLRTDMTMTGSEITVSGTNNLTFSVINNGNEAISDYDHIEVFSSNTSGPGYSRYTYSEPSGTINTWAIVKRDNDIIHPNQTDPGEKIWITATFVGQDPIWVQVTTNNGVSAQIAAPAEGWRS